jgi:hypothetical protein
MWNAIGVAQTRPPDDPPSSAGRLSPHCHVLGQVGGLHDLFLHGQCGASPSLNGFGSSMKINHADVSYVRRNEDINRVGSEANTGNKIE